MNEEIARGRKKERKKRKKNRTGRLAVFAGRPYDTGRGGWPFSTFSFLLFLFCLSEAQRLTPGHTTPDESHKKKDGLTIS